MKKHKYKYEYNILQIRILSIQNPWSWFDGYGSVVSKSLFIWRIGDALRFQYLTILLEMYNYVCRNMRRIFVGK